MNRTQLKVKEDKMIRYQGEKIEPLTKQIEELTRVLEENRRMVSRITSHVDSSFQLPKLDDTPQTANHQEHPDYLTEYLKSKYHIHEIEVPQSLIDSLNTTDNTVIDLAKDVYRLNKIRNARKNANIELYEIIKEYESFIVETLLPQLRQDIQKYHIQQGTQEMKSNHTPRVLSDINKVWENYYQYVNELDKVCFASEKLMIAFQSVEETQISNRIYQKLVIIREIRDYLTNLTI